MSKTEVIPFRDFMDGSYKNKKKSDITVFKRVITATTGSGANKGYGLKNDSYRNRSLRC
ncbi:hypothetical protein [Bacillus toyonensis]|uniref:hypothetical protein n=1 Tax=Bacillus toyonensis TaxID=155322 RepID=UPI00211D7D4A|nr:hypothetical protein [Bacillus toyonensis]